MEPPLTVPSYYAINSYSVLPICSLQEGRTLSFNSSYYRPSTECWQLCNWGLNFNLTVPCHRKKKTRNHCSGLFGGSFRCFLFAMVTNVSCHGWGQKAEQRAIKETAIKELCAITLSKVTIFCLWERGFAGEEV